MLMKSIISVFCLFLAISATAQKTDGEFHLDKEYKISPTGTIDLRCSDAKIYITHLKPGQIELIMSEIEECAGDFKPKMLQNKRDLDPAFQ